MIYTENANLDMTTFSFLVFFLKKLPRLTPQRFVRFYS